MVRSARLGDKISKHYNTTSRKGDKPLAQQGKGVARQVPQGESTYAFVGPAGEAYARLRVTGPGQITVFINFIDTLSGEGEGVASVEPITINSCASGATSTLALLPHKAYRHVHDGIALTAIAYDASNQPVKGANVTFALEGGCDPRVDRMTATTDVTGVATVTVVAHKPGALTVRAAATGSGGVPVLSQTSNIIYFDDHHDADDTERRYWER